MEQCIKCNGPAIKLNIQGLPVCSQHFTAKAAIPTCPNCKLEMVLRDSKYGKFWGCRAFPMCDGTKRV